MILGTGQDFMFPPVPAKRARLDNEEIGESRNKEMSPQSEDNTPQSSPESQSVSFIVIILFF